jgi:hypothetical protein
MFVLLLRTNDASRDSTIDLLLKAESSIFPYSSCKDCVFVHHTCNPHGLRNPQKDTQNDTATELQELQPKRQVKIRETESNLLKRKEKHDD